MLVQKTRNLYRADPRRSHFVNLIDDAGAISIYDEMPCFAFSDEGQPPWALSSDGDFALSGFLSRYSLNLRCPLALVPRLIVSASQIDDSDNESGQVVVRSEERRVG